MFEQLVQELCALEQTQALALGGSRAGTHFDQASDYDVYLYCTAPIPEDTRRQLLSKYCSVLEIGNHFWEYEDNGQLNNGIGLDILYRDLDRFVQEVADVVEGFQARNAYTTCMWHNLLHCKILYDRDGSLARAQERFSVPYPPQLQENILQHSWKLLHSALPAYEGQLQKALKRGDQVSVCHRTAAFLESYFDFLFALNGLTHPGEKRQVQLCLEQCQILPARFEETLSQLFRDLFAAPDQVAAVLNDLIAGLEQAAHSLESPPSLPL